MSSSSEPQGILIVDDNPTNLEVLSEALTSEHFQVAVAIDGESALEQVQYLKPELILLDVMMPGIDGFETCRRLKENPDTMDIPIIFMTALSETESKVNGLSLGAVDYITKPFQHEEVLARIRVHLKLQDLTRTLQQQNQLLAESRDVLEHRVAERTQELNAIIDNLGDGLLVLDKHQQVVRFNPALLSMFHLQADQLSQKSCQELFGGEIAALIQQENVNPDDRLSVEVNLANHRVGQALMTSIPTTEAPDPEANGLGAVILIRDVTAEKEVDRMKTDFISTVSHELRTPLTSVLGFAKLIQRKLEDVLLPLVTSEDKKTQRAVKQVRDNLGIIVAEGERLTSLINDVLDLAKIEAGKVEWHMEPVLVADIVDRAVAATHSLIANSGLKFVQEVDPQLPKVVGDSNRLIQVVINLISNAIKFTETGSINCRADLQGQDIIVSITDTGLGISEADQAIVFDKFKQVGEVMTNKPKGTGLGLSICKQIVEHHGGQIWVNSQLGEGTTFSFSIPISTFGSQGQISPALNFQNLVHRLHQSVDLTATPEDKSQKTIFVVDDEPYIRELLRQELESHNYIVKAAKDGVDAIQQIKADPPDLIILDVKMPTIDGYDLAAVLKNDPVTMTIPTIILSIIQDQERGYRLGIDRYLSKPIDIDALLLDIRTLLTQGSSRKKVLVIDTDTSATRALTEILLSKGYVVSSATTGSEGISKALSIQPDMIIVDSVVSKEHNMVKTLRFENGLENIFFVLVESSDSPPTIISSFDGTVQ
jgi:PAS domain S-box-containing protein